MSREPILVEDGETIIVIAKTPGPTVSDPADERPYVSQAYRVVADRNRPTLALVPLLEEPTAESHEAIDEMNRRRTDRQMKRILELLIDPTSVIAMLVDTANWKFPAPIIVEKETTEQGPTARIV